MSDQKYEVRAVKLKIKDKEKGTFVPEIVLHDKVLKMNTTHEDCENVCHADFVKSVHKLRGHLGVATGQIPEMDFEDSELIDEMNARGYSISGNEDEKRVVLKGYRKFTNGSLSGTIQLNSVNIYVDEDKDDGYHFVADLNVRIKAIESEALKYCLEGKKWEDPQLSLNMPESGEKGPTKAHILPPVTDPSQVGKQIADEVNAGKDKKDKNVTVKKVPQSAKHKSGEVHE